MTPYEHKLERLAITLSAYEYAKKMFQELDTHKATLPYAQQRELMLSDSYSATWQNYLTQRNRLFDAVAVAVGDPRLTLAIEELKRAPAQFKTQAETKTYKLACKLVFEQ